jgi:hypothetical protein
MTISMVGGARWPAPRWSVVGAGIVVLAVGIAIARARQKSGKNAAQLASGGSIEKLVHDCIAQAVERTELLFASGEVTASPQVADSADAIVRECIERVASQQELLTQQFGFVGYAAVMTPLAAAERWLFRAWSAASDEHTNEVRASLQQAQEALSQAQQAARELFAKA